MHSVMYLRGPGASQPLLVAGYPPSWFMPEIDWHKNRSQSPYLEDHSVSLMRSAWTQYLETAWTNVDDCISAATLHNAGMWLCEMAASGKRKTCRAKSILSRSSQTTFSCSDISAKLCSAFSFTTASSASFCTDSEPVQTVHNLQ